MQPLPAPTLGGVYRVVIDADAGPGRQATLPFVFPVAGPAHVIIPPAEMLAAPQGQHLWDRTITAWRSFPARLPLLFAALLLIVNGLGLASLRMGRQWVFPWVARRLKPAPAGGGSEQSD